MGVHGLWELLAPVGRRVSVETLAGKKLAIDASIWMVQFMKAMRDEKGEMVRNAHILGFFRRICKLLFLRTKPVFVFDGGTPALKRRTVIARRRHRENAQAKIRKTAEKLLLNHLKAMKLKELAEELEKQKKDAKGKGVLSDQSDMIGKNMAPAGYNQEALDELLAASLAAEENRSLTGNASTSAVEVPSEEDDADEDEEMVLPTMNGKVDPAVLAALPPSMQLDLLVQMRERLMAENRQKYQKVKKAPAKFSELQIESYLKTVAFRREIDEVQKSAAGRGVGGVQTSRIASEANREYIFSSSFSGDKQVLASAGSEESGSKPRETSDQNPSPNPPINIASKLQPDSSTGLGNGESTVFDDGDVETYLDARGHVRLSRGRALGIRMTRDLQRNLDLMKEKEQERMNNANEISNTEAKNNEEDFYEQTAVECNEETTNLNDGLNNSLVEGQNQKEHSTCKSGSLIEISFEDDGENKCVDGDDDLFACLVSGTFSGSVAPKEQSSDSGSDGDWEEGIIEGKGGSFTDKVKSVNPSVEGRICDESEEEWELGACVVPNASCPDENSKPVSKGYLEEEASIQEAIKRSIEDLKEKKSTVVMPEDNNIITSEERVDGDESIGVLDQECEGSELSSLLENVIQQSGSSELVAGVEKHGMHERNQLPVIDSPNRRSAPSIEINLDLLEKSVDQPFSSDAISYEEHGMGKSVSNDNQINQRTNVAVTEDDLAKEMLILGQERLDLGDEQRKLERNAESVSGEMFTECQELLQMFGLPYIIAPMEAEAQCAYMEMANLVDGVVTDDSDVFLFGARSVYKNIFDERKYVETYFMKDIENELGLSREKLIRMALLLGSDYTEGVSGIGIVNAIEVVNAFPEEDGLHKFREWIESPDPTILGKFDRSSQAGEVKKSTDSTEEIKQIFMEKHRNVSKNWHIPSSFPSEAVISAYNAPALDKSTEPFSWGKPDLFALRKLCWEKFGWGSQKSDELLQPVLKEYNKHETQLRLEAFYTFNEKFAKIRSNRIKKAVRGITGNQTLEPVEDDVDEVSKSRKKRKPIPGKSEKSAAKQSRKRKVEGNLVPSEAGDQDPGTQAEGRQNNAGTSRNGRGRGRGRDRGRGKVVRRKRKGSPASEISETSSSDGDRNTEQELQSKSEVPSEMRRSTRPKRDVKYQLDDLDFESTENPLEEDPSWDQASGRETASELGDKNQFKMEDQFQGQSHHEMGGGFCMDEGDPEIETGQLGSNQTVNQLPKADLSKSEDYLETGGGFCLDESENTTEEGDDLESDPTNAIINGIYSDADD